MNDPKKTRVLIVDDDPDDAALLRTRLQHAGYMVRWAEDERSFATELKLAPDLIVADYTMPAFGALRVLELVAETGHETPVIVVSGAVGEDRVSELMKRGAADYLLKDRLARLEGAIEQALRQRRLQLERMRAEHELADREARLAAVFAGQPDCVMVVDRDGSIRSLNPAGFAMFEATDPGQVIGSPLTTFLHASDRFTYWQLHRAALAGDRGKVKFRLIGLHGTERWMEAHSAPLDADGEPAVLSIVRDITASRRAELRTRESESVMKALSDVAPVAFWLVELQPHRVLFVTAKFAELVGRTCEEIYADASLLCRPDPRRLGARAFEVTRDDGSTVSLQERALAIRDEAGDVNRIAGIVEPRR